MEYIIIKRLGNKVKFVNQNQKESRLWGPRMEHKGFNVYKNTLLLLGKRTEVKIETTNTNYILRQPDLFISSQLNKKND